MSIYFIKVIFFIEDEDLRYRFIKTLIITNLSINIIRAFTFSAPYMEKEVGKLTYLEIRARKGLLTTKETIQLFFINIFMDFSILS